MKKDKDLECITGIPNVIHSIASLIDINCLNTIINLIDYLSPKIEPSVLNSILLKVKELKKNESNSKYKTS